MEEDIHIIPSHICNQMSKLDDHHDLCYICLDNSKQNLLKIGLKFHERLLQLGLVIVKTSISSNSLCTVCYTDIKSSLDTIEQVQKANLFWQAIYVKTGHCVEKPKLPEPLEKIYDRANKYKYKCLRCISGFMTKSCLNNHTWKDHLRLSADPTKCSFCSKKFTNEKNCRKHVFYCHEAEKTYLCTICGKCGMTKPILRLHCLTKHDGQGYIDEKIWYTCEICKGVRFQSKHNYDDHMYEIHNVEKPVLEQSILQNDVSSNVRNKKVDKACLKKISPFRQDEDSVIKNDASTNEEILEQIDSETIDEQQEISVDTWKIEDTSCSDEMGETVYIKQEFAKELNLDENKSTQKVQEKKAGIESYQCPQCNERFSRFFYYLHIWEHFRQPKCPTVCKLCDKKLKTEESCRKHFMFKHYEKYQVCDICGKGNMTQLELFQHKKIKHFSIHKKQIESRKKERQEKRDKRLKLMSLTELTELASLENTDTNEEFQSIQLKCPICNENFNGSPKIATIAQHKHIWEVHQRLTDGSQCPSCKKHFEEEFHAKKHYFFMHFEPYYTCDTCKKSGMTYNQLKDHMKHELKLIKAGIDIENNKKIRNLADNNFTTEGSVCKLSEKDYSKEKRKFSKNDFKTEKQVCPVCNEKFFGTDLTSKSAYLNHAWEVHGKAPNPKNCNKCNKSFTTEYYAKAHFYHQHWDKAYTCEYCGLVNLTKKQLYHHTTKTHESGNKTEQLNCPYCCKKFKDPMKFDKHKQSHLEDTDRPKLVCETCKKIYRNNDSLKEHQLRAHIKVFSHHCRYCDRGFYSYGARNIHEISIHTKEYPFQCRFCSVQCTQKVNLKLHVKRAHDLTDEKEISNAIIRIIAPKRRTKEEVEAQKIYVRHDDDL